MDLSGVSPATLAAISGTSTRSGDAVTIKVLKKAMDIQASNAAQLIASVQASAPPRPDPGSALGQNIDVRV